MRVRNTDTADGTVYTLECIMDGVDVSENLPGRVREMGRSRTIFGVLLKIGLFSEDSSDA